MLENYGYGHILRICDTSCFSTATMVTRTRRHFTLCIHCLSPCAQPRGDYFHLEERNEDSTETISAWAGVVVCLVIGVRAGMSDRCLTSPKSETQYFTCQPFCFVACSVCVNILCCLTTLSFTEIIQRLWWLNGYGALVECLCLRKT